MFWDVACVCLLVFVTWVPLGCVVVVLDSDVLMSLVIQVLDIWCIVCVCWMLFCVVVVWLCFALCRWVVLSLCWMLFDVLVMCWSRFLYFSRISYVLWDVGCVCLIVFSLGAARVCCRCFGFCLTS